MYAVIETGGKQYKVQEGDIIRVEKLDAPAGESIELDRVFLVSYSGDDGKTTVKVGRPTLEGAKVAARVLRHGRAKKILVFKYKPKKNYRRRYGHRQPFTELRIEKIEA
ncbi:MAG TPA: 50S ribosomal protein L21 [Firmicutes bacterium]|nr:50S ribosomal protein L21 [Bacillota bacterium]